MSAVPEIHLLTPEQACARMQSRPGGLTVAEAAARLLRHGPNELQAAARISPWALLLAQFKNVLIVILLIATALSALLGHGMEAVVITVIVLFAALLGFVQEYRAERAVEALRRLAAPTATVLRDGDETEVRAREVVPGDVILLQAGDRIPADCRLLEAVNLQVRESSLTGESVPVEKITAALTGPGLPVGDRRNMGFAGTSASYGRGRGVVTATGMDTEFGRIARLLETVEIGRTPLQENLDRLGRTLARAALMVVAVITVLGLLRGQPLIDMLVFGIALAVAVVPEALPAVVTISLAIGVQRLIRRNALIRRLPAVETLGSTSVICTDKTGTLTRDEMTVRRIWTDDVMLDATGTGYEPHGEFHAGDQPAALTQTLLRLLEAGALSSDADLVRDAGAGHWRVRGDPTEGALVVAAEKAGLRKPDLELRAPRVDEIPFASERKRMTTLHRIGPDIVAFSKGAPEVIVAASTRRLTAAGEVPLDDPGRDRIMQIVAGLAGNGMRVLALAMRAGATRANAEQDQTLLGLVGMIDPLRPEVPEAVQRCVAAGIRVVMITGDHPLTARSIGSELRLLDHGRCVTGREIDGMDAVAFAAAARAIAIYARVSPEHKFRVVEALQAQGQVVAMTGDGVNDAPALKKADIGIAMGVTGTDVAREAAAMTLTDDNFASIVAAVEEGRGIFANIKKYLMFLLSANLGEIGLMAGAALLGLPLPLSAVQILYVNLATDGLPALALAVDPPLPGLMRQRPRDPRTGVFTRPVVTLMLAAGAWSAVVNLAVFAGLRAAGHSDAEAMGITFVTLVLIQFVMAYAFRSEIHSALRRPFANRWLNLAILWELLLLSAILYVPWLQKPFGTFALEPGDWAVVTAAAISVLPVMEAVKWRARVGAFRR
ncbi:MAG: cation-translocating P-type ATPase [Gammaproteobacteria bacterium]|nr:cation-translocating P-type ATPase [Gammaproteobacteria bacterium]